VGLGEKWTGWDSNPGFDCRGPICPIFLSFYGKIVAFDGLTNSLGFVTTMENCNTLMWWRA